MQDAKIRAASTVCCAPGAPPGQSPGCVRPTAEGPPCAPRGPGRGSVRCARSWSRFRASALPGPAAPLAPSVPVRERRSHPACHARHEAAREAGRNPFPHFIFLAAPSAGQRSPRVPLLMLITVLHTSAAPSVLSSQLTFICRIDFSFTTPLI